MASGAAPSVVRAVGSGDAPPPASPAPALVFEEHFTKVGRSLAEGSFGQVFVAEPTPKGEAYLRTRLRELGRAVAADAELPRLIVKAPIIDRAKLALLSESEREYREKDAATEKAALREWHHPGIVTYFGDFVSRADHNRPHLVLEACNGVGVPCDGPVTSNGDLDSGGKTGASRGDFWRYVATRLHPSDSVFRFIAWQLLAPVAYLHVHEVAHRDLKNENFLVAGSKLSAAGEVVPVVKISDFGTTRVLTIEEQTGPHDRSPTLGYGGAFGHADPQAGIGFVKYIGTPQHIAPELLRLYDEVERKAHEDDLARCAGGAGAAAKASPLVTFRGQYSTKCDIYSLGIALYATLKRTVKPLGQLEYIPDIWDRVGRPTFLADCRINLERRKRLLGDGREERWSVDPVAPDTVDFVLSMLTLDPADRPSAAKLLASPYFDGIRAEARALFGHERGDADGAAVGAGGAAAGGAAAGGAAAGGAAGGAAAAP